MFNLTLKGKGTKFQCGTGSAEKNGPPGLLGSDLVRIICDSREIIRRRLTYAGDIKQMFARRDKLWDINSPFPIMVVTHRAASGRNQQPCISGALRNSALKYNTRIIRWGSSETAVPPAEMLDNCDYCRCRARARPAASPALWSAEYAQSPKFNRESLSCLRACHTSEVWPDRPRWSGVFLRLNFVQTSAIRCASETSPSRREREKSTKTG